MFGWTVRGVAEAIGLVSIVGSLVFVGLELRQNSVATNAAANSAVSDAFIELNLALASSPELAKAVVVSFEDPTKLSPEDRILVLGMWRTVFHVWSNAHRQWTNETLDEVLYESVISEISTYGYSTDDSIEDIDGRARSMRWAWESERFIFNTEFQHFVDKLIGKVSKSK